jgi:hypothetical protein
VITPNPGAAPAEIERGGAGAIPEGFWFVPARVVAGRPGEARARALEDEKTRGDREWSVSG